ncbi:hypothetical protein C8A00DRAFT_30818 [Chaetomidium leptoderma]|uniref:Uncharacterized protein n=1 Tax=Chaetomidium leptoderma TaxID=669021 RepID=A0AAN6ZZW7_9PEZI|nr:hypothetical protein C8A00DRAFT_30818 [Chaetomidium leptoderma]
MRAVTASLLLGAGLVRSAINLDGSQAVAPAADDDFREPILDDPYDYAPEEEADWRAEGAAWAVADFFELLKDQFRQLCFVPLGSYTVCDMYTEFHPVNHGLLPMVQAIYREHGWPNLERYRKEECLRAVMALLEERYPLMAPNSIDGL